MKENVRLGYACVNVELTSRPKKQGGRVTTSRTARMKTWHDAGLGLLGELAVANAKDLLTYLKWNEANHIYPPTRFDLPRDRISSARADWYAGFLPVGW